MAYVMNYLIMVSSLSRPRLSVVGHRNLISPQRVTIDCWSDLLPIFGILILVYDLGTDTPNYQTEVTVLVDIT